MVQSRYKKAAASRRRGIEGSARAVASPPANAISTNDKNITPDGATSTSENSAPNPAPIISVAENPATTTTTTESPVPDNPGPVTADAASTCDENSATDKTANTAFTCDTGNTTEKPAPPTSAITVATNNPPTSGIGATATDKTVSPPAEVTNPVSASKMGTSNTAIDDPAPITEPTINNATAIIKPSDALPHNSAAVSSIQNTDTALERDDPPIPIHNEDAPFEFDDEIPLDGNAPTKRGNASVPPSASSKPMETPNDDASQENHSLAEPALSVSEEQLAKTDQDRLEWLRGELCKMVGKRRRYKAEVEVLEKGMATAGNGETMAVDESGSSICQPIAIDLTLGKYDRPTTISEFGKTRFNYLRNLDTLVEKLAAHIRCSVNDDESANYDESGEERENRDHAQVTTGSKRSLNDFLSNGLVENKITGSIVAKIVSEVQEFGMALKRE